MTKYEPDLSPEISRVDLWHFLDNVFAGNALEIVTNTALIFNMQVRQNPAAANDQFDATCYLKSGTWTIKVLYMKISTGAMLEIRIFDTFGNDYAPPTDLDTYIAGSAVNQIFTDTFTVKRDGWHRYQGRVWQRNAANTTGWNIYLTGVFLWRTGD